MLATCSRDPLALLSKCWNDHQASTHSGHVHVHGLVAGRTFVAESFPYPIFCALRKLTLVMLCYAIGEKLYLSFPLACLGHRCSVSAEWDAAAERLLSVLRSDIDKDIGSVMSMSDTVLMAICQNNCTSVQSNDKCLGVLFITKFSKT